MAAKNINGSNIINNAFFFFKMSQQTEKKERKSSDSSAHGSLAKSSIKGRQNIRRNSKRKKNIEKWQ